MLHFCASTKECDTLDACYLACTSLVTIANSCLFTRVLKQACPIIHGDRKLMPYSSIAECGFGRSTLLFCALKVDFADFSVVCYVGLVYPRPRFGLLPRGEAVRDEPAQFISMQAPETTMVVPNGSHYCDSHAIMINTQ